MNIFEKIGTFSSLSAYHERRARESGSMRELHSALGDCWEGQFEVKKNPIPCRVSLIGTDKCKAKYLTEITSNGRANSLLSIL